MGKNQNGQSNRDKTSNLLNEKTNEDYNKKHPDPNDPNQKKGNPNTGASNSNDDDKETQAEKKTENKYFMQLNDDGHDETANDETYF